MTRVVVLSDAEAVAQSAAARLLVTVQDVLTTKHVAHIVLTGGTVGTRTLAAVASSPLADSIDWTSVHVWWGDERFVPSGHSDRNEGQAQQAMLSHLPIPEENIHRMGASDVYATADEAASAYLAEIEAAGSPKWDVLMLGLGPDGHVASLFPAHDGYTQPGADVIAVHDSPKPPPTRVSLGLGTIQRADRVWVVAAGAEKADSVARCLHGDRELPGAAAHGEETLWLIDAAASTLV